MKHSFKVWFQAVTMLFAVLSLTFASYAWFTSNREVSTSTATARTGDETLELQLSTSGGSDFRDADSASIRQINQTSADYLLPVSTNNLQNFVYSPVTQDGMAKVFQPVENEAYYYHGRVYIRASGEGWTDGTTVKLYLDQSDNILGEKISGDMLNAARLGLVFDEDYSQAVILKLSESENSGSQQTYNTVVNGRTLHPVIEKQLPIRFFLIRTRIFRQFQILQFRQKITPSVSAMIPWKSRNRHFSPCS